MELLKFEEKIKEILFYCRTYGAYTLFDGKAPTTDFDGEELNRLCYDGFKIAQSKILFELRDLQKVRQSTEQEIKQAKRERNQTLLSELTEKSKTLDYQSDIFRNLADSIAWQMINGQHYFYRRLFTYESGEKNLNDKSFEYVIDFTNKINENRDSFCLITDITHNIQLGDCLIVDKEGIKVSEIKSGKKNSEALELIEKEQLNENNVDSIIGESYDKEFKKQIKRMLTQKGKTERAAKIIKENEGPDSKLKDSKVKIIENDFEIETYHSAFNKLFKQLEEKDWAYDCIEAIVHVGVYKNDWRLYGQPTMKGLCKPYSFYDLISNCRLISEPIFMKPFTDKQILDIVLGRVKIYIGIDYEKFIEFSNFLGIKASWSTSKELHKYLDNKSYSPKEIFSFENRGIKVDILGQQMFLGQGFFMKIIFDQILPSTMLLKYQYQLTKGIENK
ncbi:hypothetical protein SAMN05444274_1201 [Mariniphaga anaerophila]|uniref:Uncharacterized protein n=1 Tax=Mariniphaga anaerophila TaxID=1484053 RepID=A0A1M5GDS2_9BACT|nr:hypothetical protein [Mariniphaga anaerophila]SHG01915.1 hypothetical protein SAMN05444274_1201 [Mariniphaga anaerophila]